MKICTKINLATWLRLVKFNELNISKLWFLNSKYISCHWGISKNKIISEFKFSEFAKFFSRRVRILTMRTLTLKKAWRLISSASLSWDPSLLSGFLRSNLLMIAIDSVLRNLGYRTSSLTIESNTSSSSSPGKGDSPTNISNMRTPRPHQSTARVYDVSVNTSGARNSVTESHTWMQTTRA